MVATLDKAEACLHPQRGLLLLAGITWGCACSPKPNPALTLPCPNPALPHCNPALTLPSPYGNPYPALTLALTLPWPCPGPDPNQTACRRAPSSRLSCGSCSTASGARSSAAVGRSTSRPTCAHRGGASLRRCALPRPDSRGWRPRCWPRGLRSQAHRRELLCPRFYSTASICLSTAVPVAYVLSYRIVSLFTVKGSTFTIMS